MKIVLLRALLLVIFLHLGGCRWFTSAGIPYFRGLDFKVPEGTPTFQKGYKDGCSTILFARGNGMYRDRYEYRFDPKMIGNPEYRFGHSRGQSWCFQNLIGPNPLASADRYLSPYKGDGYGVFEMAGSDIGGAWDGMFGSGAANGMSNVTGASLNGIFGAWAGGGDTSVLGANPIWAGNSKGQIFGQ